MIPPESLVFQTAAWFFSLTKQAVAKEFADVSPEHQQDLRENARAKKKARLAPRL
jgi:hypothetical protein